MPDYELVALLILSVLGPVVLGLILLAVVTHAKRAVVLAYACGMLVLLAAVSASVGFNMYAATLHRDWWSDGPMWWVDVIAAFVTVVLGFIATVELLPELASD
jgi:hypothetical protein